MERLQDAIEKARAERSLAETATPRIPARPKAGPPPAPPEPPASDPDPAPDLTPEPAPGPAAEPATGPDLWENLEEITEKPRLLRRRRISAYEGGPDAAPFDMLRTRMLQQARHNGWTRIALVSPHSNCGKSTAAANLAFSIARQKELKAIILDMDLRRAGLTRILGQSVPFGMADILERKAGFADQARRYGTNIAFGFNSGTRNRTPSEILQSRQAAEVLDEIAADFAPDVMIFDMPPLFASDDNFGFLQNVDAALILTAADRTPMSQIDIAERQVAELTNVMGIVLNKCRYATGAYGHEYDYY